MARPIPLIMVLCLTSLTSCLRQDRGRVEGPVRVIDPDCQLPALLLSEIAGSKVIEHRFEIENRSAAPQQVRVDRTSCNCVGLSLPGEARELTMGDNFVLGPNERKTILLAFRIGARAETQAQTAHLVAAGPAGEEVALDLRIVVPVLADLTVVPPVVYHEISSSAPASAEKRLVIRRSGRGQAPPLAPPRFVNLPPQLELTAIKPIDEGELAPGMWTQGWEASLMVHTPPSGENTYAGSFLISLATASPSTIRIPVTLRRCSGVEVNPPSLDFGVVPLGEPLQRKIHLSSADERPFELVNVESDAVYFKPSVQKSASGLRHWVDITFDAREVGEYRANIVVETTHPDSRRLTVQVRGTCR